MSIRFLCGASALPLLLAATPAQADHDPLVDTIVVSGQRIAPLSETTEPVSGHASLPDAAALAARLPGAALIGNGALSGQLQYRGLFSERLSIRVGGQSFQIGGPNAMDPPLHYAPAILLDRITVSRGAAQVGDGPGLGASVDARLKSVGFGTGVSLAPAASLAGSWRSTDDGISVGGVAGLASESLRFNAIAAWEEGDDYRFPGGRVADSSYRRLTWGLSAGWRSAPGTLSLDYRRQETGSSGNPPFAMDIDYFRTDFLRAAFEGEIAGAPVELALGHVDVGHGMDNFSRRPPPAMLAQYRYATATAQTFTGSLKVKLGALGLGVDGAGVDRTVIITNPNNAAFLIGSLDRVSQHRWGGFAELAIEQGNLRGDLGLRLDRHGARMAAPRTGAAVPGMVAGLAATTAAALAPRRDTTWDAVGRLWFEHGTVRPRLTLSRKERVPNAVERFSWLPTEASGGLADGNIYIGNRDLKPEVALAIEAGVDIGTGALKFRPSLFWRRIDNYIQGTPVPASMPVQLAIAAMNGDATPLMFSNTDATLRGFDADMSWQIAAPLRLEATVSHVRGKRRDIADNLYRIAPLNGRASLTWEGADWSATAEVVMAARQKKVSATNGERASSGWAVANAWFDWSISRNLRLSGGIENLFDRRYADHLAGLNRVRLSDVAVGERLPASGRSAFLRLGIDL